MLKRRSNSELEEVENFLHHFAENLLKRLSPEIALVEALERYDGELKPILEKFVLTVIYEGKTVLEALKNIEQELENRHAIRLLEISMKVLKKDSVTSGKRILSLVNMFRENRKIVLQRQNIIAAQRFKVKFLIFTLPVILGLMAALSPLFSLIPLQEISEYNFTNLTLNLDTSIYLILSFGAVNFTTAYFLMNLTGELKIA
ncbi:MAG: hypothetical protein ACTSQM_04415, partial [Candidatus Odinarchaeia archaeon]